MKQLSRRGPGAARGDGAGRSPAWSRWRATGSEIIYQGAFGKRALDKPDAMTPTACSGSPR